MALLISASFLFSAAQPAIAGGKHYVDSKRDRAMVKAITAQARKAHLGKADIKALITLAGRESDWNPNERTGSCLGLFQIRGEWVSKKGRWRNPTTNTRLAIKYIKHRYGTTRKALAHSYSHNWY